MSLKTEQVKSRVDSSEDIHMSPFVQDKQTDSDSRSLKNRKCGEAWKGLSKCMRDREMTPWVEALTRKS